MFCDAEMEKKDKQVVSFRVEQIMLFKYNHVFKTSKRFAVIFFQNQFSTPPPLSFMLFCTFVTKFVLSAIRPQTYCT